ncbi:hypothetical protein SB394_11850 [Burkholderia sp. BCCIQ04A]|uniref:Uncharacterized protein n=1 Tax=Burkholderia anthinoferrum TaxID=3090833 RepID=A0ABU5WQ73_9BURK|nr:hypothetical protein [Burkholderia anthinoferrum]MEB2504605.1 hypothetical protein [Burkholderia anthinoferrum]MEB2530274.1 hypothetical protein [Burkholderia anthinoferrum]MEB2561647.1 hypothetical protein [Burkholderia anthinoferrum]MEB2580603.1 hypothetical protein [Burkholderia anthinoferrum]MEB2634419.1 hypothetical protein [Burkholderia anthinoferrum]
MKIVYVFNDRRPTDLLHPIVAISDDGVVAGVAHFDDWTLPFARFAMHVIDDCDAPGSDAFLIARTRQSRANPIANCAKAERNTCAT